MRAFLILAGSVVGLVTAILMWFIPFQVSANANAATLDSMHQACSIGLVQVLAFQQCQIVNELWTLGVIILLASGFSLVIGSLSAVLVQRGAQRAA